jgi:hypothetical protein
VKSHVRWWPVAPLIVLAVPANDAWGQAPPDSARPAAAHARCRDPHPFPVCGSYLLVEYTASQRIAGTKTPRAGGDRVDLPQYVAWDIGWMKNVQPSQSLGVSLQGGASGDGNRIAIRLRHRTWMASRYVLDVGAGPLMAQHQGAFDEGVQESWGATADAGVGVARVGVVSIGFNTARQSGHTASSMHLGGRLESAGVVVATVIGVAGVLILSSSGSLLGG